MSRTRTFYPVPGRLVRDPVSAKPLPPGGRAIRWEPDNPHRPYWLRALREGDITETAPVAQPAGPVAQDRQAQVPAAPTQPTAHEGQED